MVEYPKFPKIPSLFKRSPDGKKVLYGVYREPIFEYLQNNIWVFTEKVDGTNIRVIWDGYDFHFRGRKENSQIPVHLLEYLKNKFLPMEPVFEDLFGDKQVILFGEGYGHKIQSAGKLYRPDKTVDIIFFHIMINNTWVDNPKDVITAALGLSFVPHIYESNLEKIIDYLVSYDPFPSIVGEGRLPIEGVVGMPKISVYDKQGNPVMVKITYRDIRNFVYGE